MLFFERKKKESWGKDNNGLTAATPTSFVPQKREEQKTKRRQRRRRLASLSSRKKSTKTNDRTARNETNTHTCNFPLAGGCINTEYWFLCVAIFKPFVKEGAPNVIEAEEEEEEEEEALILLTRVLRETLAWVCVKVEVVWIGVLKDNADILYLRWCGMNSDWARVWDCKCGIQTQRPFFITFLFIFCCRQSVFLFVCLFVCHLFVCLFV